MLNPITIKEIAYNGNPPIEILKTSVFQDVNSNNTGFIVITDIPNITIDENVRKYRLYFKIS